MKKVKVVKVTGSEITFDDGTTLYSTHEQDCCEGHSLTLDDLTLDDFDGLEFDLTNDGFFEKVEDYGIKLIQDIIEPHNLRSLSSNPKSVINNLKSG